MNCNEARQKLDAQLDHELGSAEDAEVSAHLRSCADCTALAQRRTAWNKTVTEKLPRFAPPPHLATRIRAELRAAGGGQERTTRGFDLRWWSGLLGAVCSALVIGFFAGRYQPPAKRLGDGLVASHVAGLMSGHLIDVVSSDRHTVKPWLSQHVDFSPPVRDFAAEGFPLDGARVERIDGQLAAALVYHRAKHVVTVYVWPEEGAGLPRPDTAKGYHVRVWTQAGFNYAAISDVNEEELDRLVTALRSELPATK